MNIGWASPLLRFCDRRGHLVDVTSYDFLEPPPWTLHIPVGWESQRGAFVLYL